MAAPIFRTAPVPASQPALYQLSIRAPGQNFAELATYTFPLTPTMLQADYSALTTYSDTQGPPGSNGVTRVPDSWGLSPPVFTIEGTTGWDKHLADGFVLSGLQSLQLLQKFLQRFTQLNQLQVQQGNSQLYALEFYDYFSSQFWQIQPSGPQIFRQAANQPLLIYYRFRWIAIAPVGLPVIGTADALATTIATPAQQAAVGAARTLGAVLVAYSPVGPLTSALSSLP